MAGKKRSYVGDDTFSTNPSYHFDRTVRPRQEEYYQPISQDSWRSYKSDTTNLQQIASPTSFANHQAPNYNAYGYNHLAEFQQPKNVEAPYMHSRPASSFQPISFYPVQSHPHSVFTHYQPLRSVQMYPRDPSCRANNYFRFSNGNFEKSRFQQIRHGSSSANSEGIQQESLRSRNPPGTQSKYYSEHQTLQSSSVPANIVPLSGLGRLRPRVPHNPSSVVRPPPRPAPTVEYLNRASLPPAKLTAPQKLLVVVDLNGTLLRRSRSSRTSFILRPGVTLFMDYLFANHVVMVYTSSRPVNAQGMVNKLLHPRHRKQLAAVWARDKLGLTSEQYLEKVQTYKNLEKIWADEDIQKRAGKGRSWDQSNTVLIDDSHLKGAAQPYNLLQVDEFLNDRPGDIVPVGELQGRDQSDALNAWNEAQQKIIEDLRNNLETLKWTEDVSRTIRSWQTAGVDTERTIANGVQPALSPAFTADNTKMELSESDSGVDVRQFDFVDTSERLGRQRLGISGSDAQDNDSAASDRSVSPIDDSVWKDILGGIEEKRNVHRTGV